MPHKPGASSTGFALQTTSCSRCGLPLNWGLTRLDQQGVCNYCRYYDTVKDKLRDFDRWKKLFIDTLNVHKGKYEYDVAVGFSGGKDSSYIVHILKNHYNCKVLAVTVNFDFMPTPLAIENSKRVARSLKIDHIVYDATAEEIKQGFKNAIERGMLCSLCTALCVAFTRKIALERHIPFYIMGADRGQLLRDLSPETGPLSHADAISNMLTPYSEAKTWYNDNRRRASKMRKWLGRFYSSPHLWQDVYPDPQPLPGTNAVPLSLQFFLFHPYKEKEIKRILQEETDWQLPPKDHLHAHHDCKFHDAATYFMNRAVNTTITTGEICVDVREGEIEREEALQVLQLEAERLNNMERPYSIFEEQFGIPEQVLLKAEKKFRRRINLLKKLRNFQLKFMKPKLRHLEKL